LAGKHRDIPLELAKHYYNQYAAGKQCKVIYQQYPKEIMRKGICFRRSKNWNPLRNKEPGGPARFPRRYEYEKHIHKIEKMHMHYYYSKI
jgi:hypothetical protein